MTRVTAIDWTTIAWTAIVGAILAADIRLSYAWSTTATTRTLVSNFPGLVPTSSSSSSSSSSSMLPVNNNNRLPTRIRTTRINCRRYCSHLCSSFGVQVQERRRMCHLPTIPRRNSEISTGFHGNKDHDDRHQISSPLFLSDSSNERDDRNNEAEDHDYGVDIDDNTNYEWLVASPPLPDPFYPPYDEQECTNRKKEMMLIANLNCGDDSGVALFKDHWFAERERSEGGSDDKEDTEVQSISRAIRKADLDIGRGPDYWKQSQQTLLEIVHDDWANLEARARLSKLFCLMGKFELSKKLSMQVLESKPWHFVAMETMTAISVAENDQVMVDLWKSRRLPNPSKTDERRQWVERALQDAENILQRMQEQQDQETSEE